MRPLKNLCEVAVIGGGLAGLSAARHAARLGRLVTLFEGTPLFGGLVAIMGLGGYGTRVAEAMQSCAKAKLVGVISGTPAKITAWQSKYNIPAKNCYNYENYDEIKNNPDIDAVYVITPNALHHDAVIRVAKRIIAGKPTLAALGPVGKLEKLELFAERLRS